MAAYLDAKGPTETVERRWTPAVASDDAMGSVSTSASGITVSSATIEGDEVLFVLTGGTAAATGTITATVVTEGGETLVETLYVPIIASPAQIADTAREYIDFALRKITGPRRSPSANELDDGLEHLNAMIAEMRASNADVGAPFPLTADSVIYCPDWAVSAVRYNLRVRVMDLYGIEPSAMDFDRARRGMQLVKHKNLPADRVSEFY